MPRIIVTRNDLLKAVLDVRDAAGLDSPKEQHHHILLIADGTNLRLVTMDQERSVWAFSDVKGFDLDSPWRVAVPAISFGDLIDKIMPGELLKLEADGPNLNVYYVRTGAVDDFHCSVRGYPDNNDVDLPVVPNLSLASFIDVGREQFLCLVQGVSDFMTEEASTGHNSISVDSKTIRATNDAVFISGEHSLGALPDFAVPSHAVGTLINVLRNQKQARKSIEVKKEGEQTLEEPPIAKDTFKFAIIANKEGEEGSLVFQFSSCSLKINQVKGLFTKEPAPVRNIGKAAIKVVIPSNDIQVGCNKVHIFSRDALIGILGRLMVMVDQSTYKVKFVCDQTKMLCLSEDPIGNKMEEKWVCSVIGSSSTITIGFNCKYLTMAMKYLNTVDPTKQRELELLVDRQVFGIQDGNTRIVISRLA